MKKLINKLICHFKGHISLQRGQGYKSIYYSLKNSGAFCRGTTSIYHGRLYHCSRCGELYITHGVLSWELQDIILETLKDLPKIDWMSMDYSFSRNIWRAHENT